MCPVSVPDIPPLRPALTGVRRGWLLRHCLGHFHRRDEAHFLRPRRGDHPAHCPAWKLQRKTSDIMLFFYLFIFFFLVSSSLAHYFWLFVVCFMWWCVEKGTMWYDADIRFKCYGPRDVTNDIVFGRWMHLHIACPLNRMTTRYCSSDIKLKEGKLPRYHGHQTSLEMVYNDLLVRQPAGRLNICSELSALCWCVWNCFKLKASFSWHLLF